VQGALPSGIDTNAIIPRADRVKVNEFNQVEGYDNIFAIGDIAAMMSEKNPIWTSYDGTTGYATRKMVR
jgi:NADH:ubiquinone reductase (H+-translocating)